MPPRANGTRASSRLRSVPPETQAPLNSKPPSRKRAASVAVEQEKIQPRKRTKNVAQTNLEPITEKKEEPAAPPSRERGKPRSKAAAAPPPSPAKAEKKGKVKEVKEKSATTLARGSRTKAINAIPESASHPRPCRLVFVFGQGEFGQFGLGTETLDEIPRPRLHAWFETAAKNNTLGSEGAGLEMICAGGMHSLAIDEAGKVSHDIMLLKLILNMHERSGRGVSTTTLPLAGQLSVYRTLKTHLKLSILKYSRLNLWFYSLSWMKNLELLLYLLATV